MKEDIEQQIRNAIKQYPLSMRQASIYAKMHFGTFKTRAEKLGIYKPNQSGKGVKRNPKRYENLGIPLTEILRGEHPQYSTNHLKRRLLKEEIKKEQCELCGQLPTWNGKKLVLQLDHKDGNNKNHKLDNLQIVCPNCHTQTDTFSGRNASDKTSNWKNIPNIDIIEKFKVTGTPTGTMRALGLNTKNTIIRKHIQNIIAPYVNEYYKMGKNRKQYAPVFTQPELQQLLWEIPLTHIGKKFNMSGSAIGRWVKKWNLDQPPRGYFLRNN